MSRNQRGMEAPAGGPTQQTYLAPHQSVSVSMPGGGGGGSYTDAPTYKQQSRAASWAESRSQSRSRSQSAAHGNVLSATFDNRLGAVGGLLVVGLLLLMVAAIFAALALAFGAVVASIALGAAIGVTALARFGAAIGTGIIELLRDKLFYDHERGMGRDQMLYAAYLVERGHAPAAPPARALPREVSAPQLLQPAARALPAPQEPDVILFDTREEAEMALAQLRNQNGTLGTRHADW